jgi:ribonuclease BN (tRNA processing enzyme)
MKWHLALPAACCFLLSGFPASGQDEPALRAVIIGSGSPQYNAERNGPGVMIEYGEVRILVDAGNGTQAELHSLNIPIRSLDGVLFTHHHLDHNEEFVPVFIQALLGGNTFTLAGPSPMRAMTESTLALYDADIAYRLGRRGRKVQDVRDSFTLNELSGGETFSISDVAVRSASVQHTIAATAYRFDAGGRSIVVSGDLVYSSSLPELAQGADVLIIDSGGTIKKGEGARQPPAQRGASSERTGRSGTAGPGGRVRAHVTLEETARMAREAGVRVLVLTHFTTGANDEAATIAALRDGGFAGKVIFAEDSMVLGSGD